MAVRAAYAAGFEAEAKTPDGMMESRAFRSRRERQETSRLRLLPAASPPEAPIEAPPGAGLVHAYLIDTDPARRAQVHKQLSGRSNMVVRAYRDYASFLAEADLLDAGCVILSDDGMDAENRGGTADAWLDFIRQSRQKGRFACILLTREGNMRFAIDAMKAGAVDCLLLSHTQHALLGTVEDALALVRAARAEQDASSEARGQIERLTARERDVLHGLLYGKSNKMIALDLGISPRTVEIYRAHLMEKLGTHSLSETLRIAFLAGIA